MTNKFDKATLYDVHKFCPILGKLYDCDNERLVIEMEKAVVVVCRKVLYDDERLAESMSNAADSECHKVYQRDIPLEKIEEVMIIESIWNANVLLNHEEWVIMGHSHSPSIDYSRRAANTGGWTNRFGFEPSKGQGILLINEEISLVNISG